MIRLSFLASLLWLGITACNNSKSSINKFSDPVIVKIYDLKDHRNADSLYQFLTNENPAYRYEAAMAFASIQDSIAVVHLEKIALDDTDSSARRAAVFALGQTPGRQSSLALEKAIVSEKNVFVQNEILEAYGKVTSRWKPLMQLENMATTRGLVWSLYRASLNNRVDSSFYYIAAAFLDGKYDKDTRLGAAHFFSRSAQRIEPFFSQLASAAQRDATAEVRMACAFALRKIKSDSSRLALGNILKNEKDYRVKVNSIRALQSFSFDKIKDFLYSSLLDKNPNVSVAASEVIRNTASEGDWIDLANHVNEIQNWRAQANVYRAIVNVKDNASIVNEIKSRYQNAQTVYQKAALLESLSGSRDAYDFIERELFSSHEPVIRLSAATVLSLLTAKQKSNNDVKQKFITTTKKAFESGDPAVIGIFSGTLGDSANAFRDIIKDFEYLKTARQKLSLPRDIETIQPLDGAIAYFERRKPSQLPKNDFNHAIDWMLVKTIAPAQRAIVRTSHGTIVLRLRVEEAPGSVANFVALANKKYFDHKFFHRVVPNFVVQAGSERGDGWGSDDYSIRSEFYFTKYKTGSVGMASAGKDTEGTQWFITHSPTPHLDGRYTLFAEVESGLDAVHHIEVGDEIIDLRIESAVAK